MSNMACIDRFNNPLAINSHLAEVVSVNDPQQLSRVQIRLLSYDEEDSQDAALWARVAVPFAGDNRGAFFIPDVGDEVIVTFINGDTSQPIVIGGLWSGKTAIPETLGGSGENVDRWSITGKAGTRVAIVEESAAEATILFSTPNGTTGELTDSGGGKVEFKTGGTTITMDTSGVTISTSMNVTIQATKVCISASMVNVDAGITKFSGVVQADTIITNSIIAASYTPGAGNIW